MKNEIQSLLYENRDEKYADFQSKLIPTLKPGSIIGVRTPDLRRLAKELSKRSDINSFLDDLPHKYFEENQLHAFIISEEKNFGNAVQRLEKFLPYIDNWATCDQLSPKVFKRHCKELLGNIENWIKSSDTYTVRFGMGMLMRYFLDENFKQEYLVLASQVESDEYYVKMMIAWYFATALAKQYDAALPYIEKHMLEKWTHNKAIQKAAESYRITQEQKDYLKTLKIKSP